MNINVKILNPVATLPTRGSAAAAGYDLYSCVDAEVLIPPHTTVLIGTGLAFEIPDGHFIGLYPRSGIASKRGLRLANCVGVCDSDYIGEYFIPLHNDTDFTQHIESKERIAQMILHKYEEMDSFIVVDNLSVTERGTGGFGSTGVK